MKVLYVGKDNSVVLSCPGCEKAKRVDVSKHFASKGTVKLTYRFRCESCECGHKSCNDCLRNDCSQGYVNTVRLERRMHFRKDTKLTGTVTLGGNERFPVQVDLSRKGARIRIPTPLAMEIGAEVLLNFQLDDRQQSDILKEGKIVRGQGHIAALAFNEVDSYSKADKSIGFYLMQ